MIGEHYIDPFVALGIGHLRPGVRVVVAPKRGHHKTGWKGTVRGADTSAGALVIVVRLDNEPGPSIWEPDDLHLVSIVELIGSLDR